MRAGIYDVLREIWKSVAVPSIMYGMEVIAWSEKEIDKGAPIVCGLPRYQTL